MSFGLGSKGAELPEPGRTGLGELGKFCVGGSGSSDSLDAALDLGGNNSPLGESDGLLKGGGTGVSTSSCISLGGSLSDSLGAEDVSDGDGLLEGIVLLDSTSGVRFSESSDSGLAFLGAAGFGVASVGPSDLEPDDLGGASLGLKGFETSALGTEFG